MSLNIEHDSIDDIPEAYRELYTEREGKFYCTGISGIKTQADIDRMNAALEKERNAHKETRDKLRPWAELGVEIDDVTAKLDRFVELEVAARGNKEEMEAKLEELTEARVRSRLAPVEREARSFKEKYEELLEEAASLRTEKIQRSVKDGVTIAAKKAGIDPDAMDDVQIISSLVFEISEDGEVVTKENPYGFPAGLNAELFFQEAKTLRPRWFPPSVGGGAPGSKGGTKFANNPWSKDGWNITQQGKIFAEHGQEKCEAMARAAGTVFGGPKPV